jgi:DNA-binding transcriptional ArsR family regulator
MDDANQIQRIANLLADPARAAMLWTLIDGTLRPAGELAFAANVSAQSASGHLAKLVDGGLLVGEAQGRHRYFRIVNAEAARLIEGLASFGAAQRPKTPPQPALARAMPPQFLQARTCYDHLAGDMAVQLLQAMVDARWLLADGADYRVTRAGRKHFAALGLDDEALHAGGRRALARGCVDLTQRRPHLAGRLGAALLALYDREGWILRSPRSRTVSVTPKGRQAFRRHFGVAP